MITSTSGSNSLRRAQQIDATHVGHSDVGDDQVGRLLLQLRQRVVAIFRDAHDVPFALE